MAEKLFIIFEQKMGSQIPERLELKESELTKAHKDLFLGNLILAWGNAPEEVREKFIKFALLDPS